ncbi:uncharacterized protein V5649_005116 [Rhynchonycteris naso]
MASSFYKKPEPGDLIEISRTHYSHWAIYVGHGYVVHLTPPRKSPRTSESTGKVKRELLTDVVRGCSYWVNNHLDHLFKAQPVTEMIRSAKKMIGEAIENSVLSRNCEHFVTDVRYGKARSQQSVEEPRTGDMIEILHDDYKDWALYVGHGYVIHLTLPRGFPRTSVLNMLMFLTERVVVTKETLWAVTLGCNYRVNNRLDHQYRPRTVDEIIGSAEDMIGYKMYVPPPGNNEKFITDLRYGRVPRELSREDPIPGDIIAISRDVFQHWAIYVGGGYVVHVTTPGQLSGARFSKSSKDDCESNQVTCETLKKVAGKCKYWVSNYMDNTHRPRPVEDIVYMAKKKIGQTWNYNLFWSNCEHFVIEMRYGAALEPTGRAAAPQRGTLLFRKSVHIFLALLLQVRAEPKPGDLIEIFRIGYQHWAIYVGDGYVVHLAPPGEYPGACSSSLFSVLSNTGEVKRELLTDVVGGCVYRVNNYLDGKYKPLPVNKIISSAKEMIGKRMVYSIISRNCEHFVTDLRYGKPQCQQVENFKVGAVVTGVLGALALVGYGIVKNRSQKQ